MVKRVTECSQHSATLVVVLLFLAPRPPTDLNVLGVSMLSPPRSEYVGDCYYARQKCQER